MTISLLNILKKQGENIPDEILYITYYNDYCAFNREYIIKCMSKRKLLNESIKEEIKYDSDYEIRKYADRYIKN